MVLAEDKIASEILLSKEKVKIASSERYTGNMVLSDFH